jgi:hypothetical protein
MSDKGKMQMVLTHTPRGFALLTFYDAYGARCSLQQSSLATDEAVWFGLDDYRMHLTRDMVAQLLPILQEYVETGEIGCPFEVRDDGGG